MKCLTKNSCSIDEDVKVVAIAPIPGIDDRQQESDIDRVVLREVGKSQGRRVATLEEVTVEGIACRAESLVALDADDPEGSRKTIRVRIVERIRELLDLAP